jgi:type II secretory pathway pseudopilin PulG
MEAFWRKTVKPADNTESGFTLIETLVAFVILSGVVIIALSTMTESLQRMQQAARVVEASKVAQQVLDNLIAKNADGKSIISGQQDKYAWRVEIIPLPGPREAMIYPALITVSVAGSNGISIPQSHLETIRMVRKQ